MPEMAGDIDLLQAKRAGESDALPGTGGRDARAAVGRCPMIDDERESIHGILS